MSDDNALSEVIRAQQARINELEEECDRLRNALLDAMAKVAALVVRFAR